MDCFRQELTELVTKDRNLKKVLGKLSLLTPAYYVFLDRIVERMDDLDAATLRAIREFAWKNLEDAKQRHCKLDTLLVCKIMEKTAASN